jgi:HEAT repeat protein
LLETAIVTLMALGQPSAGPALFELTHYRRPEIRLRAIEAIAAVRPPGGEQVLIDALSDADSTVRSGAAVGLGDVGTEQSIEVLFRALDHGNLEASIAIGKLVPARDVRRLFPYIGNVPFRSMAPAFAETLKRKDVPDSEKLAVVARLEEVGTGEVKSFFGDLMTSTEGALPPAVSKAALRAMQEIAEQ